ncbi:energy transducer TonB [Nannocystis bainbridge]|uniref:Energy transducer TonB n=1 Tax=Nannocystis bainbridge TaxID=2995303 RepID=A0ABT5DYH6_9BACT|nr:energy transducer TonB [Nannocystis bainbridge]MDC0718650.1 energy transducer TonB [Nannocystis bainbridge]
MSQRWNIRDIGLQSLFVINLRVPMFNGFDPATRDQVFVRRNKRAIVLALFGHMLVIGTWAWRDRLHEPEVAVLLEPEIKDFAVDEQPEPEVEEEPPPPPPPDVPKPQPQAKPKPKPKLDPPKVIPVGPPPEQAAPSSDKNFGTGQPGQGSGPPKQADKPAPPKKPDPPKPAPPPKKVEEPIDPTKPVDRPERASVPTPDAGNKMPDYPGELRDGGIEGEVVLKLHVHRDGTVKGAKILRATNTASGDEEKTQAEKLFKAAVIGVVKGWKYTPSKLDGEPISVWIIVNFPFKLTGGG